MPVSIHAPRAGRDLNGDIALINFVLFQSTRPVRGATMAPAKNNALGVVSIHAPRAGRDVSNEIRGEYVGAVSIHAPRAGRDLGRSAYSHLC